MCISCVIWIHFSKFGQDLYTAMIREIIVVLTFFSLEMPQDSILIVLFLMLQSMLAAYGCVIKFQILPYCCVVYSTAGQSGRFSTDGIIQSDATNNTFVQCSTTHLTSFAVLVDTMEQSEVNKSIVLCIA